MPRDLRHLLEDTAVEPSRPLDPAHIVDRARRQTLLTRAALSVVAIAAVALGAVAISQIPQGQAPEIAAQPSQPADDGTGQSETASESAAPAPMTLSEGERRWQDSKPDSYRMTVMLECFCPMAGTWEVTVNNGSVDGHMAGGTQDLPETDTPTIDRLYEWATASADAYPDAEIQTSIDERGVPWEVDLDAPDVVDEELAWLIEEFTAIESSASGDSIRVLDASVESDATTLRLTLNVCDPDRHNAEVTRSTEEAVHVRATAEGGSQDDCAISAYVTLEEPLGGRKVVDAATGQEIETTR